MSMLYAAMMRRRVGYEILLGYLKIIFETYDIVGKNSTLKNKSKIQAYLILRLFRTDVNIVGNLLPLNFQLTMQCTSPSQDAVETL